MKIVYNSFDGRCSDSPRALHRGLLERSADDQHTWIASPAHAASFPVGTLTVPPEGPATVAALEDADLVISNTHLRPAWTKKRDAFYLQTWHGTPLKHIAGDEPGVAAGAPVPGHEDIARWDLLLAPNAASAGRLAGAFAYRGPVAVTGYPRNDVLLSPDAGAVRERVRARLGLGPGDRAVLYTPTWRDDVIAADGRRGVDLHLDLDDVSRRLSSPRTRRDGRPAKTRTVLLLRLHYMVSDRLGPVTAPGVLDVSAHPDVAELYLAADAMITDYSSSMFDFAVTRKPLLFFVYDLEHYRDDLRGFYVDLEAVAPGPLLRTSEEVVDTLAAMDAHPKRMRAPWKKRYRAFRREFAHAEDGSATARVLDLVLPALAAARAGEHERIDAPAAAADFDEAVAR